MQSVLRVASVLMRSLPESDAEPLGDAIPTLLTLLGTCEAAAVQPRVPPSGAAGTLGVGALEACVECLDACRALPKHRLLPSKKRVLRALEKLLDHRKRRVRQAACRCANQWHLLAKHG